MLTLSVFHGRACAIFILSLCFLFLLLWLKKFQVYLQTFFLTNSLPTQETQGGIFFKEGIQHKP